MGSDGLSSRAGTARAFNLLSVGGEFAPSEPKVIGYEYIQESVAVIGHALVAASGGDKRCIH
jgi:hypothetical protein